MVTFLLATVYLLHSSVIFCQMFPNERTSLDDCTLRYYRVEGIRGDLGANGEPTRIREFPHMAAIGWTKPNGAILWLCGGSLIWDNFVLTAAHCVCDLVHGVPDVVRLGDIDLYSPEDDEWAQQFRIEKIVKHPEHSFKARYHDIALLKLDRNVVEDGPVIPACLWKEEEIRFNKLVATGWGSTGHEAAFSPRLLQMSLKPISIEECTDFYPTQRRLKQGLQDQHLCAQDEKMDTCRGDSGGPLQVKLMHNARMTPFIVAVTTFGNQCGVSNPGVYTRVSSYYKWIIDTMRQHGAIGLEENYNETLCALRYVTYREYDEAFGQITDGKIYYFINNYLRVSEETAPKQLAKISWNGHDAECYGVILDEDTVLTVADCANFEGKTPSFISYLENKFMEISKILAHPKHVRGSAYNNIAILKMSNLLDLSEHFVPSCILHNHDINKFLATYGKGRRDINKLVYYGNSQLVNLQITFNYLNRSTCQIPTRFKSQMKQGLADEHLCIGHDVFLVPGSCEQLTGSMVGYSSFFHYYTYALSLLSRDCGFGEHLISTRLDKHVQWMKSVLLPSNRTSSRTNLGDIKINSGLHPDILNCYKLVEILAVENHNGSLVNIGWISNNIIQYNCLGSIISRSFVLTTASCLGASVPNIVLLIESDIQLNVDSVLKHPDFSETNRINDIALVKLRIPLIWNSSVYPICLWTNKTHTPIEMDINYITSIDYDAVYELDIKYDKSVSTSKKLHPMYNTDCQKAHQYEIPESQLCTRSPYQNALCVAPSDQLIWKDADTKVKYLVGMSTNSCSRYKWKYNVFTRIAAFTEWISENLHCGENFYRNLSNDTTCNRTNAFLAVFVLLQLMLNILNMFS